MNYPSMRIEGGILSPDILERLDDLPGQRPADFGLDTSTKVKDEIARAWADAQDYWRIFQRKLDALRPEAIATTETRNLWVVPLLGLLRYDLEFQRSGVELNDKNYAISHRAVHRANAPVQIIGYRDPAGLDRKPENATRRMSAHALVQEYLNLADQLYGIVSNGRVIRLLRDSSRLIKLSYIEFDLDRIFTDGLFADFAILYRLLHASRLPVTNDTAAESLIERYHQDSLDSGARIREGLSKAVEQAIRDFANGFLANPNNTALVEDIKAGKLSVEDFYKELLRLIYRLLFLMVIEERDLVFPITAPAKHRDIYRQFYSLQRLRTLSEKRYLADARRHDLWLALLANFRLFEADGPGDKLSLAPLAGDLFNDDAIRCIAGCTLGNDVLLRCLRSLNVYEHPESRQLIRVNYAALNVEEFGSVYEGLLEYEPQFLIDGPRVEFDFKAGDERAATGSHYTPDELVQPLIKHSLDYLIADRLKAKDPEAALLDLRVADIACGSGHILLAAARRIATELAIVRTGEEQPSPTAIRAALRDVIRTCIYGVDLNPLAVELCKVALWLEAHNPGQPLNFLDHHIKCGNAIVGFVSRDEVNKGVPDEALATLPGDDKDTAAALRKRNKEERKEKGQLRLELSPEMRQQLDAILAKWKSLSALPEKSPAEIDAKKREFTAFTTGKNAYLLNQIAAIPIAQFYLPKTPAEAAKVITDEQFRRYWSGAQTPQGQGPAAATAIAHRKRFFHWFLEFPEVMAKGGFDCILGNPPFLGNRDLSGTFGGAFLNWVRYAFAPAGSVDLVTYFFRRVFALLRDGGVLALISTKTISQGNAREGGLSVILSSGGSIHFARRAIRWPGVAAVDVCLVGISKGPVSNGPWLDGRQVASISSYLDADEIGVDPVPLMSNVGACFQGTIVLGKGFVVTREQAAAWRASDALNDTVLIPYLTGDDINSRPDSSPSRFVIDLGDTDHDAARALAPECFEYLSETVRKERADHAEPSGRDRWWVFWRRRHDLYSRIRSFSRVFVINRHTKYVVVSPQPTNIVYSDATVVFAMGEWSDFAILSGFTHDVWSWKEKSTMGSSTLRYLPSKIFASFPRPQQLETTARRSLEAVACRMHQHRQQLMQTLRVGLTDLYNLMHHRHATGEDIAKVAKSSSVDSERGYQALLALRRLHVELDQAVLHAYGWDAGGANNGAAGPINLAHDFYEVETLPENDRVRYTISPAARQEVLKRLLALNHKRAAEEAAAAPAKKTAKKRGRKKTASAEPDLFAEEA